MDEEQPGGVFIESEESPEHRHAKTFQGGDRSTVDGLLKLNLGCGDKHWPGFVNCDYVENWSGNPPDVGCDLTKLPFANESASEAHAIHVVEHFPRMQIDAVLKEWARVLVRGGKLAIECPCLEKIFTPMANKEMSKERYLFSLFGLYGNVWQGKGMQHYWCYTSLEMKSLLVGVGFSKVAVQEPIFHQKWRDMRLVATK